MEEHFNNLHPDRETFTLVARNSLVAYAGQLLELFERYGEIYTRVYLYNREYMDDKLSADPYLALEFFLQHSFYRGRKNSLSAKYLAEILKVLYECEEKGIPVEEALKPERWQGLNITKKDKSHLKALYDYLKGLTSQNYNIYKHLKGGITDGGLVDMCRKLGGIKEVGRKISSFILRDIMLVAQIDSVEIKNSTELACVFPIDTHVSKIVEKYMGISSMEDLFELLKRHQRCSALKAAQIASGMWFSYYHAFDLLLEEHSHTHPQRNFSFSLSST